MFCFVLYSEIQRVLSLFFVGVFCRVHPVVSALETRETASRKATPSNKIQALQLLELVLFPSTKWGECTTYLQNYVASRVTFRVSAINLM